MRFFGLIRFHGFIAAFILLLIAGCGNPRSPQTSVSTQETGKTITTPLGAAMVLIPAGEFQMGNANGEEDEKPVHNVRISAFYMDKYEVTQKEYEKLMGRNPSKAKTPDNPVEQLSWFAAVKYCNARSLREGLQPCYELEPLKCHFDANGYRLPTEAEWEYACRAGKKSDYSFGDRPDSLAKYAWFKGNANKSPHPVGQKAPNPWGLYDMHGNVWEWCNDKYGETDYQQSETDNPKGPATGATCVLRGGGWNSSEDSCRSSTRYNEAPGLADVCFGYDAYGFRCVRKAN